MPAGRAANAGAYMTSIYAMLDVFFTETQKYSAWLDVAWPTSLALSTCECEKTHLFYVPGILICPYLPKRVRQMRSGRLQPLRAKKVRDVIGETCSAQSRAVFPMALIPFQ